MRKNQPNNPKNNQEGRRRNVSGSETNNPQPSTSSNPQPSTPKEKPNLNTSTGSNSGRNTTNVKTSAKGNIHASQTKTQQFPKSYQPVAALPATGAIPRYGYPTPSYRMFRPAYGPPVTDVNALVTNRVLSRTIYMDPTTFPVAPGPIIRLPQGPPQGPAQGPPQGLPQGPPQGPAQGPPQGPAQGLPQGPPQGPAQGLPQGPPQGPVQGPPQGPAQGPPQGLPQGPPPFYPQYCAVPPSYPYSQPVQTRNARPYLDYRQYPPPPVPDMTMPPPPVYYTPVIPIAPVYPLSYPPPPSFGPSNQPEAAAYPPPGSYPMLPFVQYIYPSSSFFSANPTTSDRPANLPEDPNATARPPSSSSNTSNLTRTTSSIEIDRVSINSITTEPSEQMDFDPVEEYLKLPRELFPRPQMLILDPNPMIDVLCSEPNVMSNEDWMLDLEYGSPRYPVSRPIAIFDVRHRRIHCRNAPDTVYPGYDDLPPRLRQAVMFYYDVICSQWYKGYVALNFDGSVVNYQSWLRPPTNVFGMCWP